MGQYLSAPATTKESEEGYAEALAYGLSAMQGWRVSMEDAHIAELDLDPATKTSLFAVFDGHGGRAVSQYCAAHLADEFVGSAAYRRGDLAAAITAAYFRLDELLDSEEGRAELRRLVAGSKKRTEGGAALFSDVESKLLDSGPPDEAREQEAQSEAAPLAGASTPGEGSSSGGATGRGLNRMRTGDRGQLEAEASKAMKKLGSSKDFLESHLMRASVLTPVDDDPPGAPPNLPGRGARGRGPRADGGIGPLATIESGDVEGGAATNGGGGGEEEEAEEQQPAGGMGATAVAVVVRGNQVVVANTGDSRCVLSKRGVARALTLDHKPILFEEAKRIIRAGGFVRDNRINGALNVSRTLGDLDFKRNAELGHKDQMVVATPDIETFTLEDGDEFLIIACDGIWDVLTNQEAVDFVRKRLKAGQSLKSICEEMCDACLAPDLKGLCRGADNMSVIVLLFKKHARLGGFWSALLAACGRAPPYSRLSAASETRRR